MRIYPLYFFVALLCTSCAVPVSMVKLEPSTVNQQNYWNMGQNFVVGNDKDIWFECAFNRKENEKLVFDVKITNFSEYPVLVDPVKFKQKVFKNDSLKIAESGATDPEYFLRMLGANAEIARAQAQNAATVGFLGALLSLGATVAVEVSEKEPEKKEDLRNIITAGNSLTQTTTGLIAESSDIRAKSNWTMQRNYAQSFLRKTTLPKGYSIEGEVHFNYFNNAKWYEIDLNAGDSEYLFLFRQNLVKPSSIQSVALPSVSP